MYIRVEKGSSTPISAQIVEQVRAQCAAGTLKAGECLPSVRQLAKELVVNVNTVVRVYERLAAEGWLEMRHGEGTFVLPPAKKSEVAVELERQREQFQCEFEAVVRRGLLLGLGGGSLKKMLARAIANGSEAISKEHESNRSEGKNEK